MTTTTAEYGTAVGEPMAVETVRLKAVGAADVRVRFEANQ